MNTPVLLLVLLTVISTWYLFTGKYGPRTVISTTYDTQVNLAHVTSINTLILGGKSGQLCVLFHTQTNELISHVRQLTPLLYMINLLVCVDLSKIPLFNVLP